MAGFGRFAYQVVMGFRFRGRQRAVPEEIRGWADPAVWKLLDLVEKIDLSGFERDYRADGSGGQPYDPRLMLLSVWWCYQRGIRGPEDIARACREEVTLRMVWERDRTPSAATFRRFIGGHPDGWRLVQAASVACCAEAGLVNLAVTATDSTPLPSPAALLSVRSAAWLTVLIERTRRELDEVRQRAAEASERGLVDECCQKLRRTEARLNNRLGRLTTAEKLARARDREAEGERPRPENVWAQRVDRHRRELAEMVRKQRKAVEVYQARVEAGRKPQGPAPRAPRDHPHVQGKIQALNRARARLAASTTKPTRRRRAARVAPSDPESRILKGKNTTTWVLGRLFNITVCLGQIILIGLLSTEGNDAGGLRPNLTAAAEIRDLAGITEPSRWDLADAGYTSPEGFQNPSPLGGQPLVAVTNENDQLHSDTPAAVSASRQEMADLLATERGKKAYRLRSPMVEPVFAHLTRTGRRLHTRGPAQHNEILAMTSGYNAAKCVRYQSSQIRPQHLSLLIP